MTHKPSRSNRSKAGEKGAVVVEFAIVTTLLIVISFGILEYGLFFDHTDTIADTVRAGVRTGAATNSTPAPDSAILTAMQSSGSRLGGDITGVIVFKATATTGKPAAACYTASSAANACNYYTSVDFGLSETALKARPEAQGWPWWDGTSRATGTDYIGVVAIARHDFFTKLFGSTSNFSDSAAMLIERPGTAATATSGFTNGSDKTADYGSLSNIPYTGGGAGGGSGGSATSF